MANKALLLVGEVLSLIPRAHVKYPVGHSVYACNVSTGKVQPGGILASLTELASSSFSEKPGLKNKGGE